MDQTPCGFTGNNLLRSRVDFLDLALAINASLPCIDNPREIINPLRSMENVVSSCKIIYVVIFLYIFLVQSVRGPRDFHQLKL